MQCFGGCFAPSEAGGGVQHGVETPQKTKLKLRLGSKSSSKAQQGPTYTPTTATTAAERDQLYRQYLMTHGRHILGVSTLQQDQLHHFVVPGIGYIAFAWMACTSALEKVTPTGLSDPVCDRRHYRTMAEAFLREHPNALFVQVSFEFASVLQELGFTCNSMGGETRLDIATYNFAGYARRGLRSAISAATKDGLRVEEVMNPAAETFGTGAAKGAGAAATAAAGTDWAQLTEELKEVDAKWAASKNGRAHEVWFINRPPVFAPESGVRKFVARDAGGTIQGYIFFDGVFEGGQLVGYYANVTRMLPDAHPGTLNLIIKEFLDRVRGEAQLAAPTKKLSMRKSQRKKLEAAAAAAMAAAASDGAAAVDATPLKDQLPRQQSAPLQQQAAEQQQQPAGPRFLSLGLSPFFQMNNQPVPDWNTCKLTHLLLLLCYHDGAGFYPFKTLASAKAKYGAGLHGFKYEDPNVEYRNAFLCHRYKNPYTVFWRMFDLATLYGFWSGPSDAFGRYFEYKGKQGALLMAQVLRKASTLDTYKPKKKKGGKRRSKSFSSSLSLSSSKSSCSSGSVGGEEAAGGMERSSSAPARMLRAGSGGKAAGERQKGGSGKAQKGAGAACAAAGAGAAGIALSQCGRAPSEASSLIATASNPPGAASASVSVSDAASVKDSPSEVASYVSAGSSHSPIHSSSEGNTQGGGPSSLRLSSSDSDTA